MKIWQKALVLCMVVLTVCVSFVVPAGAATIYDSLLASSYPEGTNALIGYRSSRGDLYAVFYDNVPASFSYDASGKPTSLKFVTRYFFSNGAWVSYSSAGTALLDDVAYSTEDILNKDGTIFFQGAPKPPMVEEGQLTPLMETIRGLIPLLLPLLVGWISWRKAWAWLKTQLVGA